MEPSIHRLKLGQFECISLSDGSLNYPLQAFFANAPGDQVAEILRTRGLTTAHITTPYTCLFVNTGSNKVLIDTGAGELARAAGHLFPDIDNSASVTGNLPGNLRAAGVDPAEIDTVIITHAHPDHIGGTLRSDGTAVFANAGYFIHRTEWEFWDSQAAPTRAPEPMVQIARANLRPIRDRLTLIEDETEIMPGICSLPTPGHTPGHIALAITSGGQQLLHVSDAALYPLHLEYPDWVPAFDIDTEVALRSKRFIFDRAARDEAYIFAHHFPPFPNLGRVEKQVTGWRWLPMV
jgi:glyoxylase-like metal-dependent hydrolase (beta-lactamase superfamily II)